MLPGLLSCDVVMHPENALVDECGNLVDHRSHGLEQIDVLAKVQRKAHKDDSDAHLQGKLLGQPEQPDDQHRDELLGECAPHQTEID